MLAIAEQPKIFIKSTKLTANYNKKIVLANQYKWQFNYTYNFLKGIFESL